MNIALIVLICFGGAAQAKVTCPDIACILGGGDGCINTAEIDENGCTRCVCKPFPACPDLICPAIYCEYGKEVVDGCETCRCNPAPVCPMIKCFPCPYGYVVNKIGCRTCECIDPCKNVLCKPPKVCVPDLQAPQKYRCENTVCCPKVTPPKNCSASTGNICQRCLLDCSLIDCAVGFSCCPDWFGCHTCVKSNCRA